MEIIKLSVGQMLTNCYLAWDSKTKEAVVIDPADEADFIVQNIQKFKLRPKLILATHGHVDHILAVTDLQLILKVPFLIHQKELFLVKRIKSSARYWFGVKSGPVPVVDKFIKEGDSINFGHEKLKVMETPGHSPGGVSFLGRGVVFSGDTLFKKGVGRYDFSYSSKEKLKQSIKKLLKLPEKTVVYPGHGLETNIKEEKINFMSNFLF